MSLNARYRSIRPTQRGFLLLVSFVFAASWPLVSNADSEVRKFMIEIRNSEDKEFEGVRVKCRGHSEFSLRSSSAGLVELPLAPGVQPGDQIEIELESGTDLAKKWTFLKPYDGFINVPSLKQRYYKIVLVPRDSLKSMLKGASTSTYQARDAKIDRLDGPPTRVGKIHNQRPRAQ